jgi:hypothetical protein
LDGTLVVDFPCLDVLDSPASYSKDWPKVTKQLNEGQFVPEYVNNDLFNRLGGRNSFSAWVLTIPEELVGIIPKEYVDDNIDQASYGSSICLCISGVQIDEVLGCKIITGANNIEGDFSQGYIYH